MATEQATPAAEGSTETQSDAPALFQLWKLGLVVLAGVAGFLYAAPLQTSYATAAGSGVGMAIGVGVGLVVTTKASRQVWSDGVPLVRPRAYATVCLLAGVVAVLGGLLWLHPGGVFLAVYAVGLVVAAVIEGTLRVVTSN